VFGAAVLLLTDADAMSDAKLPLVAIAAASAGFLIWNFPPARIFIGEMDSSWVAVRHQCAKLKLVLQLKPIQKEPTT
jgi:Fuc2NAc and GlcNAc transferase